MVLLCALCVCSKFMRNRISHRARAAEHAGAAQRARQQRQAEEDAAAGLQQLRHETMCECCGGTLLVCLRCECFLALPSN